MTRQTLTRKRILPLVAGLLLILPLLAAPVASQDSGAGSGAIVEGNLRGAMGIGSFNPLRCDNAACRRLTDLLFPHLIGVDPASGTFTASGDENALAVGWDVSADGTVYTFHLRDDLAWSDGEPVTAYDVFYVYLAIASEDLATPFTAQVNAAVRGAVPLDAHTIAFIYDQATCSALDHVNFLVIPAHVFEADFAGVAAAAFDGDGDLMGQFQRWQEAQAGRRFTGMIGHPFDDAPLATAGVFRFERLQPTEDVRLVANDGALGFAYVDVPDSATQVRLFLTGGLNFIENPPYPYRQDLRAADDVQVAEYPGNIWLYINFNLADPREPLNAFDEDGNRLDQGDHPLFGDVRVRRAVQLALDVEALIEATTLGNGTAMPANQLPTSWAFEPDLAPIPYDPIEASRLLEEAGWKDTNHNGVRECITCLYAEPDAPLMFELLVADSAGPDAALLAALIAEQLGQVGFNVQVRSGNVDAPSGGVRQQRYDAFLAGRTENSPVDADQSELFASAGDVLGTGLNSGSYHSERVDDLLAQARSVPGCDSAAQATLYREVQIILQADAPYAWLFAPNEMVAARGGVIGFAPYPNAPLWNVRDWTIVR